MRKIYIEKNEANQRIDKFLRKYINKASLSFIYKMIRKKNIKVNHKKVSNDYLLQEGDYIELFLSEETIKSFIEQKQIHQVKRTFHIIYEDDNMIVVDKPQGLLVHEDHSQDKNTLINQVIKYLYDEKKYDPQKEKTFVPASVNRLDRNTSGIVIIGKSYQGLQSLNEMIREKDCIRKYYLTIVKGRVEHKKELKAYLVKDEKTNKVQIFSKKALNAKEIHTIYTPIEWNQEYSLLEVEIVTGRSHQIRAHLLSIGHPIIGDQKYGDLKTNKLFKNLKSQFLHAYKIDFITCNKNLKYLEGKSFHSPLPEEFKKIKSRLFQ
ncbi:RluA family pseudouridine synthase [Anaerophilus nitritogenes]|uniref:RluA family pseudouridine synthase n=1 Tax=Anaerophilus nitritogenes TaxID=2498136 RepID=UPI00101CBC4C|nr:RluA family pseudouridine synthase [Anaerophilus nitritogenes]